MAPVLDKLKRPDDPRLLVGINTADDAGVFLLREGLALVQTVDLLTPVVEDPYTFGRIAAANSLSDVYAMGGTPLTVLNVVGFPAPSPMEWLAEILRGGQDAVAEADAVVVGGHTFNEKEIKYGLAVTGTIAPDCIVGNAGACVGDVLVLTKPLGTGVFGQLMMGEEEIAQDLYQAATKSMTTLNRGGGAAMVECEAHGATDITGYGLLGHAQELAEASGVRLRLEFAGLPFLPGVRGHAAQGVVDAGVAMNQLAFGTHVEWADEIAESDRNMLFGSETSGGLLVSLRPDCVRQFQKLMQDQGLSAPVVGEVVAGPTGTIEVRG